MVDEKNLEDKLKQLEDETDNLLKESEALENSQVLKDVTALVRQYKNKK